MRIRDAWSRLTLAEAKVNGENWGESAECLRNQADFNLSDDRN